jgi:uncharacterized protein (DUF488 family)
MDTLFTIGHSTHTTEEFIELLKKHKITALCDVRSSPYSRHNPQFNRETFQNDLKKHGIAYVYLGKELGPRSNDPQCYEEGKAVYEKIARTEAFQQGIARLKQGIRSYTVAIMCAEKDPITCHRMILICRQLRNEPIEINHILEDGTLETNQEAQMRLKGCLKIPAIDLFRSEEELTEDAYNLQSQKIAYTMEEK